MSVWLPSAPCTPKACLEPAGSATAVPRAVLRMTAVVVLVLTGIALSPFGGRIPAGLVRRWCRAIARAIGVQVRVTGTAAAPTGGLLLVANHISWLDIPLLGAVRPARMLAKAEIGRWPLAGPVVARSGVLFIERDRLRALPDTVARIAEALRAGSASSRSPRAAPGAAVRRGTSGAPSSRPRWTRRSRSSRSASGTGSPTGRPAPQPRSSATTRCSPRCGGWRRHGGWWPRSRYGT